MKVLMLDKLNMSNMTGSTVHKYQLIKHLSELNQTIFVPIKYSGNTQMKGIMFFKTKGGIARQALLFARMIKKYKIEIIYTRNHYAGILGIWLKHIFGIKLVYEVNGLVGEEQKMLHGNQKIRIANKKEKRDLKVANNADAIIAVSSQIADYYYKKGISKDKVYTIENGVDTTIFKPIDNAKKTIREKHNIPENTHVVLFIGLFFNWQGVDLLIKSFKEVYEKNNNVKLLLVGDGIEKDKLISLSNELGLTNQIIFTGRVDYYQIPLYISASDVCVSLLNPSKFGAMKMWEYLACGKPVVATRMPAYLFIEKEKCGILVEHGNIGEVAKAIIHIIDNPDEAFSLGQKGREYVAETHTWMLTAKKTYEVFQKLNG